MIGMKTLAPLMAALLLAAATLAQPDAGAGATAAPADQPAAATAKSTDTTDGAKSKPASSEKAPSDYRASEKISEDLPVSFPVDI